jgi:hypothetical protein
MDLQAGFAVFNGADSCQVGEAFCSPRSSGQAMELRGVYSLGSQKEACALAGAVGDGIRRCDWLYGTGHTHAMETSLKLDLNPSPPFAVVFHLPNGQPRPGAHSTPPSAFTAQLPAPSFQLLR